MIPSVPIPNRGEVLRASWARQLAGAVNQLSSLANNGGAKWTNLRDRRGGAVSGDLDRGVYRWNGEEFENRYFEVNGVLFNGPNIDKRNPPANGFIAIEVVGNYSGGARIVTFAKFEGLVGAMKDVHRVIIPLYKFEDGSPSVDFRRVPRADMWAIYQS